MGNNKERQNALNWETVIILLAIGLLGSVPLYNYLTSSDFSMETKYRIILQCDSEKDRVFHTQIFPYPKNNSLIIPAGNIAGDKPGIYKKGHIESDIRECAIDYDEENQEWRVFAGILALSESEE